MFGLSVCACALICIKHEICYFCACVQSSENKHALCMHVPTHICGCAHIVF